MRTGSDADAAAAPGSLRNERVARCRCCVCGTGLSATAGEGDRAQLQKRGRPEIYCPRRPLAQEAALADRERGTPNAVPSSNDTNSDQTALVLNARIASAFLHMYTYLRTVLRSFYRS
jgi:hypothetical protein